MWTCYQLLWVDINVLDFGHTNRYIMASYYYFNLHFSVGILCGAFFVLLFAIYFIFGETGKGCYDLDVLVPQKFVLVPK
jgi:hypothetical protein